MGIKVTKTDYFETAIIWSSMGLIVGFILGVGFRIVWIDKFIKKEERERILGLFLIFIALAAVAQNFTFQRHQREVTNCQTKYNVAFQTILSERSKINDKDKDNLSYLINGLVTAKSKKDSRDIFNNYVAVNKELDKERISYKYPALPQKDCK